MTTAVLVIPMMTTTMNITRMGVSDSINLRTTSIGTTSRARDYMRNRLRKSQRDGI